MLNFAPRAAAAIMASLSTSPGEAVLVVESVIRGHHIYKTMWTPVVGETLGVARETDNGHDHFAIAVMKASLIVGHVPREYSRMFHHFLGHSGRISSEVTGNRRLGKGLEVPCIYTLIGEERMIVRAKEIVDKIKKRSKSKK